MQGRGFFTQFAPETDLTTPLRVTKWAYFPLALLLDLSDESILDHAMASFPLFAP